MTEIVEIFVDAACSGNPGPGGWAYLLRTGGVELWNSGGEPTTTNNRMELTAAIKALESLSDSCQIKLYSDSEYLVKGMNEWIHKWVTKGWKTSSRKPVENQDLWQRLSSLTRSTLFSEAVHTVEWIHVSGHAGHPENEIVEAMANEALKQFFVE